VNDGERRGRRDVTGLIGPRALEIGAARRDDVAEYLAECGEGVSHTRSLCRSGNV